MIVILCQALIAFATLTAALPTPLQPTPIPDTQFSGLDFPDSEAPDSELGIADSNSDISSRPNLMKIRDHWKIQTSLKEI